MLWGADVFAHMNPVAHFCPGTSNDPCMGDACQDMQYKGGHGHVDGYNDDNENGQYDYGEENSWGYWDAEGYAATGNTDNDCGGGTPRNPQNPQNPPPQNPPPQNPPPQNPPPQNPPPQNPPPPAVATSLAKISGDSQEGLINTQLTNPFIVEVRDQNNNVFGGASVTFAITAGSGSLSTETTTTNTSGRAESTLTLGSNLGTTTVSVSLVGTAETETFSAEAVETLTPGDNSNDGTPGQTLSTFTIVAISGPGSGAPGNTLTFIVEVREDGAAESGERVDFSITSGDGNASLGSTSETAGHNGQVGQAQTTLILGSNASGSYTIRAELSSDSTVNVSGTATVTTSPPSTIYSIHVISGPGSGAPGDTLTFVVEVRAERNCQVKAKRWTFSITSGDANASLGTEQRDDWS